MNEGINNVKIIAIGKGQYSADNSDWTDDNTIPVVNDPSPNDTWTNWGASQRDLFFLNTNGNYVEDFNITAWDYDAIYNTILGLLASGCTDPEACNFDPEATVDDENCEYADYELYANEHWDFATWIHDYYKWYEYKEGDDEWNAIREVFINNSDSTIGCAQDPTQGQCYIDIWDHSHGIEFTYDGNTMSSNSDEFEEIFQYLCGNSHVFQNECSNEVVSLYDNNGDTINVIKDHHFYEGIQKFNMFTAGWDDNDDVEIIVTSGGGTIPMSPHKAYYTNLWSNKICDCEGNILSECGICGGEAGVDECAMVNPSLVGAWIFPITEPTYNEGCEGWEVGGDPDYINFMEDGTANVIINAIYENGGQCTVDEECEVFNEMDGLPHNSEFTCNQNINSCLLGFQIEWGFIYETTHLCIFIDYMDIDGNIYTNSQCGSTIEFLDDGTWVSTEECKITYPEVAIEGCTNPDACNADGDANWDDDISCMYTEDECGVCGGDNLTCSGCIYEPACNYNSDATIDDGSCIFEDENGECDGGLSIDENIIPDKYSIHSIYPNPFNPLTNIIYGLPENGNVELNIYNIQGRQVTSLVNTFQTAGYHSVNWNASSYSSGVYLIRMDSGEFTQTQKVVLVK